MYFLFALHRILGPLYFTHKELPSMSDTKDKTIALNIRLKPSESEENSVRNRFLNT